MIPFTTEILPWQADLWKACVRWAEEIEQEVSDDIQVLQQVRPH